MGFPLDPLGAPEDSLGALWGAFGEVLGAFGDPLGAFWEVLGAFLSPWELLVSFLHTFGEPFADAQRGPTPPRPELAAGDVDPPRL